MSAELTKKQQEDLIKKQLLAEYVELHKQRVELNKKGWDLQKRLEKMDDYFTNVNYCNILGHHSLASEFYICRRCGSDQSD